MLNYLGDYMKKLLFIITFILLSYNAFSQNEYKFEETTVDSYVIVAVMDSTETMDQVKAKLTNAYGQIINYIANNKYPPKGNPVAITKTYTEDAWTFIAGIPVDKKIDEIENSGRVFGHETYAGKVLKIISKGPYDQNQAVYEAIFRYIGENNLEVVGSMWEEYVNDPKVTKPEDVETHIYVPIK